MGYLTKKEWEKGRVQFISHHTDAVSYLESVRLALNGGCRWVQLRMKEASDEEIIDVADDVRKLCDFYEATFILDDHVELVQRVYADGVHLGKKDMPVEKARELLGDEAIIGGTANTFEDVLRLRNAGADYIGCGPFRFTTTKKNLSPVLGLDGYVRIMAEMRQRGIDLPLVAIGGITLRDIPSLLETGVDGVALSGSILRADNPVEEMERVVKAVR